MFFSQQGVTNDSFPCNTVAGSRIGGNSKDRQRLSLCHEYHLFCVRQKELFKVAPAPFPLSTWGSTTPSVAVWAGKKRYFKLILYKKIMKKMVQLMVKRKVVNQKLLKPGRSWRSLRAPVSTMSLPGVTPGSRWRNPLNFKKPTCSESQEDLLALDGYWGYCSPSCSGELPSPTSKYNSIARSLSPRYPGTSYCPGTASQRAPTFGTWHSSTSPPGDLASATHTIRLQRWLFTLLAPNH